MATTRYIYKPLPAVSSSQANSAVGVTPSSVSGGSLGFVTVAFASALSQSEKTDLDTLMVSLNFTFMTVL